MRISFKHILFLISLLAFLGAISAYADITQDLEDQLEELQALNKSSTVVRAPAQPIQPVALPEPEEPEESERTKHVEGILAFMQEELIPSLESQEKTREKERTVAMEKEKKPFNFAAPEHKDSRRSDREGKIAKIENDLWNFKNGNRINTIHPVVQEDGSLKMVMPEEPLFDSIARERRARLKEAQEKQDRTIENLQSELNQYKRALTNPTLPQSQLDDIIRRYQDLFIKPNTTPPTQEKTPYEQSKQDAIIQSLQETIEELQAQGANDRAKKILDEVVVKKLDQTADVSDPDSYPDPKSYKDTIKIFRKTRDTEEISVPQYYETEFKKRDTSLKDKVKEVEKLLDDSILNALNEDFSGNLSSAVAQLNSVADTLQARVLALADIRQVSPRELIGRALDKEKTPDERFAAIQTLMILMEDSTNGITLFANDKQAILEFLNTEYPAYLAQKKEECEKTGQTTLALDEEKLNRLLDDVGRARDHIANSSLSHAQRSLASQKLEHVKGLLAKIEARFDTALASGKLTKEQEEICRQGKGSIEACRVLATQAQTTLDTKSSMPEDLQATVKHKR